MNRLTRHDECRPLDLEELKNQLANSLAPQSDVYQIKIDYSWGGLGPQREHHYIINKTNRNLYTCGKSKLDANKIREFGSSIINLQKSGGLKSCFSHTDDYPEFRIEIKYEDGDEVVLYSTSNCKKHIPWNVVLRNELYVQYTSEIPDALYALLNNIDPENWPLRRWYVGLPSFSIARGDLPKEVAQSNFSEKELYLQILNNSDLFKPFLSGYEISDLYLSCKLAPNNQDGLVIDGIVKIKSINENVIESIPVVFNKYKLVKVALSMEEKQKIKIRIINHAFVKKIVSVQPDTNVVISYFYKEPTRYHRAFSSLKLPHSSKCSPISIKIDQWKIYHSFIYFHNADAIQVSHLHYWERNFNSLRVFKLSHLLEFYRVPGYETFIDDNLIDFEIQECGRIMAYYNKDALKHHPDYISALKKRHPDLGHHRNRIDIRGHCIFVNEQGELEAKKYSF